MRRMIVGVLLCVALQAWSVLPAGAQGRRAMPPVGRDWSDEEMDAMTGYLEERFGGGN